MALSIPSIMVRIKRYRGPPKELLLFKFHLFIFSLENWNILPPKEFVPDGIMSLADFDFLS